MYLKKLDYQKIGLEIKKNKKRTEKGDYGKMKKINFLFAFFLN
jgi:hypothetical protein